MDKINAVSVSNAEELILAELNALENPRAIYIMDDEYEVGASIKTENLGFAIITKKKVPRLDALL